MSLMCSSGFRRLDEGVLQVRLWTLGIEPCIFQAGSNTLTAGLSLNILALFVFKSAKKSIKLEEWTHVRQTIPPKASGRQKIIFFISFQCVINYDICL